LLSTGVYYADLVSAKPEEAKAAANIYEPSPINLLPGGLVYDYHASQTETSEEEAAGLRGPYQAN
jgi:hypothetical protein